MSSEAPPVGKQACRLHPERPAVERCASCGRPACLACAVPVRGRVLCTECARRETGSPPAAAAPSPPRTSRVDLVVAALFVLALAATAVPWDRFGIQTGVLSAWGVDPTAWSLVACIAIAAGALVSVGALVRRRPAGRATLALGLVAAASAVASVIASPPYVTHSPAPYAALASCAAAAVVSGIRSLTASRR